MTDATPTPDDPVSSTEPTEHDQDAFDATARADDAPVFVQLEVVSVEFDLPSPSPIVQLREKELPFRAIYFPIGLPEAQTIALALRRETPPRPTTADLLAAVIAAAAADVVAVRITGTKDGTMLAELDLMTQRGRSVLDCRPSDGIALVLRIPTGPPLLCETSLLDD